MWSTVLHEVDTIEIHKLLISHTKRSVIACVRNSSIRNTFTTYIHLPLYETLEVALSHIYSIAGCSYTTCSMFIASDIMYNSCIFKAQHCCRTIYILTFSRHFTLWLQRTDSFNIDFYHKFMSILCCPYFKLSIWCFLMFKCSLFILLKLFLFIVDCAA